MTERPVWQEFDPSTFTHIARNDVVLHWAADYRERYRLPKIKTIWLLGSGVVEPFTVAALPGMEKATVIAVEINSDLVAMAEDIKKGSLISWEKIGERSLNPGRANNDFSDRERLEHYFLVLAQLGSLSRLGTDFNIDQMQVPQGIADRVVFIQKDALTFLKETEGVGPDIIGDFFLQVNINKHPEGPKYSGEMLSQALQKLPQDGFYIIGDTGRNLPVTLEHMADIETIGKLNLANLVHAVNFGSGFATSHYLIASKNDTLYGAGVIDERVGWAMRKGIFEKFSPQELTMRVRELSEASRTYINLVYLSRETVALEPLVWNSSLPQNEVMQKVVPNRGDEFSEDTGALPAQKPFLSKRGN